MHHPSLSYIMTFYNEHPLRKRALYFRVSRVQHSLLIAWSLTQCVLEIENHYTLFFFRMHKDTPVWLQESVGSSCNQPKDLIYISYYSSITFSSSRKTNSKCSCRLFSSMHCPSPNLITSNNKHPCLFVVSQRGLTVCLKFNTASKPGHKLTSQIAVCVRAK